MKTTTMKEILEKYKSLVSDEEVSEPEFSVFIKFNNTEGFLEIVITKEATFKPLQSDPSVLHVQEIYTQEAETHENNYYIDSTTVQCISDCDY